MVKLGFGAIEALDMVGRGIELLEAAGDSAGALRLRHALTIVKADAALPPPFGNETPLSLMKMALAIFDNDGRHQHDAAIYLQTAIDCAREAKPTGIGEEIDPDIIEAYLDRPIALSH